MIRCKYGTCSLVLICDGLKVIPAYIIILNVLSSCTKVLQKKMIHFADESPLLLNIHVSEN